MSEVAGIVGAVYKTPQADWPGTQLAGFYNWTVTITVNPLETTSYEDSGHQTFIGGTNGWTATAEGYWNSSNDLQALVGTEITVVFFVKYNATPSTTCNYFYSGKAIVTGIDPSAAVDSVIAEPISFIGVGTTTGGALGTAGAALALLSESTSWSSSTPT